jgi:Pentatricopeptide repeat domain
MDEMRAAGVQPNSATWSCLLAAEANAGAVLMCSIHEQAAARLGSTSFMVCFAHSHALCTAYGRPPLMLLALCSLCSHLPSELCTVSPKHKAGRTLAGNLEAAQAVLTDMQAAGCPPNVHAFTKLLSAQVGLAALIVNTSPDTAACHTGTVPASLPLLAASHKVWSHGSLRGLHRAHLVHDCCLHVHRELQGTMTPHEQQRHKWTR